jgi:two-component system cell cycle sensor histidine kinase/response regulator CckA
MPFPRESIGEAGRHGPAFSRRGRGEILLVDDEDAVRAVAARVLERSGFDVVQAGSGEEALEICAQPAVACAVSCST